MEQQAAQSVYTELNLIKEMLQKIEQEVERLTVVIAAGNKVAKGSDYLSIVGLGASGLTDVSVEHDRYLADALADEHLR
jgi:hypothetical protein